MITNKIYKEPISNIVNELEKRNDSLVFLMGVPGSGKTEVLKELKNRNKYIVALDIKQEDYVNIPDIKVNKLYYVCILVLKFLEHIRIYYPGDYFNDFSLLSDLVYDTLGIIHDMNMCKRYNDKSLFTNTALLDNPEVLLDELFAAIRKNKINITRAFIDDFDKIGMDNDCQRMLINLLINHIDLICTISDYDFLSDRDRQNILSLSSKLINVDYSLDIEVVKEIIDRYFVKYLVLNNHPRFDLRVRFILTDEEINQLIISAKGDIKMMIEVMSELYARIDELNRDEYIIFITDYLDYHYSLMNSIEFWHGKFRKLTL